jgi:hypothetical protein
MNGFLAAIIAGVFATLLFYIETRFVSKTPENISRSTLMKSFLLGFISGYVAIWLLEFQTPSIGISSKIISGGGAGALNNIAMTTGVAPF